MSSKRRRRSGIDTRVQRKAPDESGDSSPNPNAANRPRRVYVLYLHGIGQRDTESFIQPTVDYIRGAALDSSDGVVNLQCETGCELTEHGSHSHVRVKRHGASTDVTIQPFHWSSGIELRRPFIVGWWVLRAAIALSLLQLVAPVGVFSRRANRVVALNRRRPWLKWLVIPVIVLSGVPVVIAGVALVGWLIWLVLRGAFFLAAGCLSFVLLAFVDLLCTSVQPLAPQFTRWLAPFLQYPNDALVWCSDQAFRRWVIEQCSARIVAAQADHHVLIGHSQGGSILTEWSREADLQSRPTTLVTLGSGQGVLATLYEALQKWRIAQSMAATLVVILSISALIYTLLAANSVLPTAELFHSFGISLQAAWLGDIIREDYLVASARDVSHSSSVNLSQVLEQLTNENPEPFAVSGISIVLTMITTALLLAVVAVIRPLANLITARCSTSADGFDLSATHDPVSRPIHVLGQSSRVRRIPQTGSMISDHSRYRENGIIVRPAIHAIIDHAIRGVRFDDEARRNFDALRRLDFEEHRAGLRALVYPRVITGCFTAGAIIGLFYPGPHDDVIACIWVVIFFSTWWAARQRGAVLLDRNSQLALHDGLTDAARARHTRRSRPRAVITAVGAFSLLGALVLPEDLTPIVAQANIDAVDESRDLASVAFSVLVLTAVLLWRGALIGPPVALLGTALAAATWYWLGSSASPVWLGVSVIVGLAVAWPGRKTHPHLPLVDKVVNELVALRGGPSR